MKAEQDVIQEFNEVVNMTASELEKWLKSNDSEGAGWSKDDGSGESVGHDSGRQIVEILKSNPNKKPDKYTEDQIQHMRKVVSYCKRHLAQEEKANNEKSPEDVKNTKSYASLKNWGHDPLKKRAEKNGNSKADDDGDDDDDDDGEEENASEDEENEEKGGEDDEQVGDKRKKPNGSQSQSHKKRETRQGKGSAGSNDDRENDDDDDNASESESTEEDQDEKAKSKSKKTNNSNGRSKSGDTKDDTENKSDDQDQKSSSKPKKGPKPGDTVSWNWGNGQPEGKVLDVKAEKTSVTTKRGNQVSRDGNPEDPAVVLDTGKSKAIKSNHELN